MELHTLRELDTAGQPVGQGVPATAADVAAVAGPLLIQVAQWPVDVAFRSALTWPILQHAAWGWRVADAADGERDVVIDFSHSPFVDDPAIQEAFPGFDITVSPSTAFDVAGQVCITGGYIQQLSIGGIEQGIDNLCYQEYTGCTLNNLVAA